MFIYMAHIAALRGTCNRLKVGAIIADDSRPISMGYNGTPPGHAHCGPECTLDKPCTQTLHAERNAIHWAIENFGGIPPGSTLYITDSPCRDCAVHILNSGVKRVVYDREYRITDGIEYLRRNGVEVMQCLASHATNAN